VPAAQSRRRRAGAGRPATPHPLVHPAPSVRGRAGRRPDRRGRRRRRPHPVHAHAGPARRVQAVPGRPAADGAA
jgi:hypothetical protein